MVLVNDKPQPEPEPTLLLRYVRGAGGGRPLIVSQWDRVKIRAVMAGLAASKAEELSAFAHNSTPMSCSD